VIVPPQSRCAGSLRTLPKKPGSLQAVRLLLSPPKNRTFSVDYTGGNTLPAFGRAFPRGGRGCALLRWFLVYSCRACIYLAYILRAIIRSVPQKVHTGFSASIALG